MREKWANTKEFGKSNGNNPLGNEEHYGNWGAPQEIGNLNEDREPMGDGEYYEKWCVTWEMGYLMGDEGILWKMGNLLEMGNLWEMVNL